jgi:hypothetical protein
MTGTDVSKIKEKLEEFRKNKPLMFRQLKENLPKNKGLQEKIQAKFKLSSEDMVKLIHLIKGMKVPGLIGGKRKITFKFKRGRTFRRRTLKRRASRRRRI